MASKNKRIKLEDECGEKLEVKPAIDGDDNPDESKRKSNRQQVQIKIKEEKEEANILTINDDCFFEILKRLTLDDLSTMSQTCKRIRTLSIDCLQRRHKEKVLIIKGISANGIPNYGPKDEKYLVAFANHIRNVTLGNGCADKATLEQLNTHYATVGVESIKYLRFDNWSCGLRESQSSFVKNVESVTFINTRLGGDLNECALKFMANMKELILTKNFNEPEDAQTTWMQQKYPMLERFAWHVSNQELPIAKAKLFFAINPNINFFSLYTKSSAIVDQLIDENIHVNELFFDFKSSSNLSSSLETLFALSEINSCSLHIKFTESAQLTLQQAANLKRLIKMAPHIEGLYFEDTINFKLANTLVKFNRLKMLQCTISGNENILSTIPNLEVIYAYWGVNSSNFFDYRFAMMTYAGRSPKLKKFYLRNNSQPFDAFEFEEMDEERLALNGACPLKIYIRTDELDYMGKLNDIERNYKIIEIVRVETEVVKNPLVDEYLTSVPLDPVLYERNRKRYRNRNRYQNSWYD